MESFTNSSGNREFYDPNEMDKEIDRMIDLAVKAAEKGENVEQLQEVMLTAIPAKLRDSLKKKFTAALRKKKQREPQGEADIPSRGKLSQLRNIFSASAKAAMQKVMNLLKLKPDLAAQVKQIGSVLAKNGVAIDSKAQLTEADLGTISPTAGIGGRGSQAGKGV